MEKITEFRKRPSSVIVNESNSILQKYPQRIPIIVDRRTTKDPKIDKHKYLCPPDLSMGQFVQVIRNRLKRTSELLPEEALFFFVSNNALVPMSRTILEIFGNYSKDGFVDIIYTKESTFGSRSHPSVSH